LEVAIKVSLGKYPLSVSFEHFWTAGIIENDFDEPLEEMQDYSK